MSSNSRFQVTLKQNLEPEDNDWNFRISNLPKLSAHQNNGNGQAGLNLFHITVTQKEIVLTIEKHSINRVLPAHSKNPSDIISISFANFKFQDALPKATSEYIERFLSQGIFLNGSKYIFYGHSNSQLKSRTCYLLRAYNGDTVWRKINEFGDFSKFMSVAKRAKRIGLLFSAAEGSIFLDEKFTADIDDVEMDGHVFTDGCGMMTMNFAQELAKNRRITFQDVRYTPSAFQIRYKGYKGMLMVSPELDKQNKNVSVPKSQSKSAPKIKVKFRASMKKFKDCKDDSFSILDFSKPFSYAFLNGELVTLLSCLGISDEIFLQKQEAYFNFLESACSIPQTAFKYFCYKSEFKTAEEVLLAGLTQPIIAKIKKLTREEWHGSYKKNDVKEGNERVRIMIPDSRILFGVCDYTGTLKEGECHVRVTKEAGGHLSIDGGHVIVSRNPCLHPGDIQKFKPVQNEALRHLVDVIVFPTVGKRDPAGLMSGGDLDGDKFFVSWDKDLIPSTLSEPYGYPPAKETPRRAITQQNMVTYFAKYNNSSLGRVKNLYLDWCRANPSEGALSKQCQELNAKFSSCVDGEAIKVPEHLQNPPKPKEGDKLFIIDILTNNVKKNAEKIFRNETEDVSMTTREVLEALLSNSDAKMMSILNEFELYLMTLHWCQRNEANIADFINYFDFGSFTTPQKHSILASLSGDLTRTTKSQSLRSQYIGPIFNALHQSDLLTQKELRSANLHDRCLRWQKLYTSFSDEGFRLSLYLQKAFEHFDKKMLVFEVDRSLKVGIYIPKRIDKYAEINVGEFCDLVKVFGFVPDTGHQPYKMTVNQHYRLTFDGEIFQLYLKKRPDTFIWFALNEEYAKRNSIKSTAEFKVSIALQKFSYELSKSRGRVTKQPANGIELYVISNRDRVGHQTLENTMNHVETLHIARILENTPRDYEINAMGIPGVVDWSNWPDYFQKVVQNKDLEELKNLKTTDEISQLFLCCLDFGLEGVTRLFDIIDRIIRDFNTHFAGFPKIMDVILNTVRLVPTLSILILQALWDTSNLEKNSGQNYFELPEGHEDTYFYSLAEALVLSTNEYREGAYKQFQQLHELMDQIEFPFQDLIKLTKLISFTIRDVKLAQDFLAVLFNFNTDDGSDPSSIMTCQKYFKKYIHALAAEYLAQVEENCPCDFWGIPLDAERVGEFPDLNAAKSRLENSRKLSEFLPKGITGETPDEQLPMRSNSVKTPEPAQKCLEVKFSEKDGVFETILRTDIQINIRNEDHLRFCASKRSSNKPKQRITTFDAIVISITRGKMEFRILQNPIPVELTDASWNVYVCESTTNLSTMCTAILSLIQFGPESTAAYDSIIPQEVAADSKQNGSSKKVDISINSNFNSSQVQAVHEALNNPLTLIWGPPGTGKTTVVVEIILNFLRNYPGSRILVSASTHNAVDNVMERFIEERKKSKSGDPDESDDAVRLTSDTSKVSSKLKKWTLDAFVGANVVDSDKAKGAAAKKLKLAKIVFSTCSGAGVGLLRSSITAQTLLWLIEDPTGSKTKKKKNSEEKFDVVIVDEASQITEPNALIPIVKASKFVILVGDHVQLRATVTGELAMSLGLETSLFERLYESSEDRKIPKVMLNVQYRMHPNLATFSSKQFYGGKLLSGVLAENRKLAESGFPWPSEDKFPFVFLQCSAPESFGQSSKSNLSQAKMAVQVVKLLKATSGSQQSIIILTPYTKQVGLIKDELKAGGGAVSGVDVNTIDGFQGKESDIIIFSTVRANRSGSLGFLDDKRRMNVAVTRARFGLIVIGDEETLKDNVLWKALMTYARGVVMDVPGKAAQVKAQRK